MQFTPESITADFPALGHGLALFDAPGGTQVPLQVADAVHAAMIRPTSNRSPHSIPGQQAEQAVERFRFAGADLFGADPKGIVHGRSATQLAMDISRALSATWSPGENIVVTTLDHDSNIAPWLIAAERTGVEVRWAQFDRGTGELPVSEFERLIDDRTRIVAVTAASNFIGTQPDVTAIVRIAHDAGALVYVDGVHHTAHAGVDLAALGCDFYAFSPYKLFGPHLGMLAADPDLLDEIMPDKLRASTNDVPERFELGTLPYAGLEGTAAMVDYLASLGRGETRRDRVLHAMYAIDQAELTLRGRIEAALAADSRIHRWSNAARRTSTLLFTVSGTAPLAVEAALREHGVIVQAGHFYAWEASRALGLGDAGGVRIGLAPYTTSADIDRLIEALATI